MSSEDWLPEKIFRSSYDGDWERFLEAVYSAFCSDFVESMPRYDEKRMALKKHPVVDGKEYTYWHFISEGKYESSRRVNEKRCERIRWPRVMIEQIRSRKVKVWKNRRGWNRRIIIALCDFSYVVVLDEREDYVLPWTAYCVDRAHRRRKLRNEHNEYYSQ